MFCTKCGKELGERARFCMGCGASNRKRHQANVQNGSLAHVEKSSNNIVPANYNALQNKAIPSKVWIAVCGAALAAVVIIVIIIGNTGRFESHPPHPLVGTWEMRPQSVSYLSDRARTQAVNARIDQARDGAISGGLWGGLRGAWDAFVRGDNFDDIVGEALSRSLFGAFDGAVDGLTQSQQEVYINALNNYFYFFPPTIVFNSSGYVYEFRLDGSIDTFTWESAIRELIIGGVQYTYSIGILNNAAGSHDILQISRDGITVSYIRR